MKRKTVEDLEGIRKKEPGFTIIVLPVMFYTAKKLVLVDLGEQGTGLQEDAGEAQESR